MLTIDQQPCSATIINVIIQITEGVLNAAALLRAASVAHP